MAGPDHPTDSDRWIVSFPGWKQALAGESFAPEQKQAVGQEILFFLHFCKVHHAGASIMLVKQYLEVAEKQGRTRAREALRWWFRAARGRMDDGRGKVGDGTDRRAEGGRRKEDSVSGFEFQVSSYRMPEGGVAEGGGRKRLLQKLTKGTKEN